MYSCAGVTVCGCEGVTVVSVCMAYLLSVPSSAPHTFGLRVGGNLGRGFPLTGSRGMKWLRPLLLQAITIGELSIPFELHSVRVYVCVCVLCVWGGGGKWLLGNTVYR